MIRMFENLVRRGRRAVLALSAGAFVGLALSGCGGAGAGAQGSAAGPGGDGSSSGQAGVSVRLVGSTAEVNPKQLKPVEMTAVVTDARGVALKGVEVAFAVSDPAGSAGGASIELVNQITDAAGASKAMLNLAGDQPTRAITVKATARGVESAPMVVQVLSPVLNLRLSSSETLVDARNPAPVTLTTVVTDASSVALEGVPVEFSVVDPAGAAGGASIAVTQGTTDVSGTAIARLSLSGTQTARDLVVTSRARGVSSQTRTVRVTRAVLSASGPATLALNGASFTEYAVVVRDLQGLPLAATAVSVASSTGNALSASVLTTDADGRATVGVRGRVVGEDTLTFGALGVTYPLTVTVGGTIRLLADRTVLGTDRKTPVELSAVVTDPNNVAIPRAPVTFSVSDPSGAGAVRLEVVEGTTNDSGVATARLRLQGDPTRRTLTVSARSGGSAAATLAVQVDGSTLDVSGPAYVSLNGADPSVFTVVLRDSSGTPIAGQTVQASTQLGNPLTASSATTDASGRASFGVRGTIAGADELRVSALGISAQPAAFRVASFRLAVDPLGGFAEITNPITGQPEPRRVVAIGSPGGTVRVTYESTGGVPPGTTARLTSTRGDVTPASADISSGSATFTVSSSFVGPATVTAIVNGATASYEFDFVSTAPATVTLQPSPSVVGTNPLGTRTQRSTLSAVVRDASGNPVAGEAVTFTALQDPSGGTIEPGVVVTNASGRATAEFIAGPSSTPTNGVSIRASVRGTLTSDTLLTVSRAALFVRVGTDNTVEKIDPVLYRKTYAAIVTDASGNAVPGATVQAIIRPIAYAEGYWTKPKPATTPPWAQIVTATADNEDTNYNGRCESGEDANGDGQLTPGNVVAVDASMVTDSNGAATVRLQYPREFAQWTAVMLEVRAIVAGSEGVATTQFWLPIAAEDVTNETVPPPGATSPFPYASGPLVPRTCP